MPRQGFKDGRSAQEGVKARGNDPFDVARQVEQKEREILAQDEREAKSNRRDARMRHKEFNRESRQFFKSLSTMQASALRRKADRAKMEAAQAALHDTGSIPDPAPTNDVDRKQPSSPSGPRGASGGRKLGSAAKGGPDSGPCKPFGSGTPKGKPTGKGQDGKPTNGSGKRGSGPSKGGAGTRKPGAGNMPKGDPVSNDAKGHAGVPSAPDPVPVPAEPVPVDPVVPSGLPLPDQPVPDPQAPSVPITALPFLARDDDDEEDDSLDQQYEPDDFGLD